MAFSDNYYYDIVILWMNQYKTEEDPHLKELLLRNIISRVYYTMLLHCRGKHANDARLTYDIVQGSHEQIIDLVKRGSIKSTLFTYKLSRKRSDYYTDTLSLPIVTIRCGTESKKVDLLDIATIEAHLKEVLQYDVT